MKTKHTPGPWRLHEYQEGATLDVVSDGVEWQSWTFAVGAGDSVVAEVEAWTIDAGYPRPRTRDEAEANARLIAAAPELLEALNSMDSNGDWGGTDWCVPADVWRAARAAIAKATGETP